MYRLSKVTIFLILFAITLHSSTIQIEENEFNTINKKFDTKEYLKKYLKSKDLKSYLSRAYTKKFYKNYNYELFWSDSNGIKKISYDLIFAIKNDPVIKPFTSTLFKLEEIDEYLNNEHTISSESSVKLDILLTGTYYYYMHYLSKGIIQWDKFQEKLEQLYEEKKLISNWRKYNIRKNIRELLYKAVKEDNIDIAINEVNFTFPYSKELEIKLNELEQQLVNGGYTKIPRLYKTLRKGNSYEQIPFLRKRLLESKDLIINNCKEEEDTCKNFYDEELFNAVLAFQKRHGLIPDGIVGIETKRKLNLPIERTINKIRLNLERMRWMPRTFGQKHIVVNIPDFKLKFYNKDKIEIDMPVVVGQTDYPTPIFSHRMSEIVLNPYWKIPQSIVRNEIIPELLKDSNYLVQNDINVYENWDHKSMQYDVSSVDWNMYENNDLIGTAKEAPMRFIQTPGKKNPLGKIKFLFPNKYTVYMHDTPFKELFTAQSRAFSHGCIRLSEPEKLFEIIAKDEEQININKAIKTLNEKSREEIKLEKKIRIHIIYLTSWIDENGTLQQRDDIYNYDKMQGDILFSPSL